VALIHGSNVTGDIVVRTDLARLRERGVPLFLDVSQSVGSLPVDLSAFGASYAAFSCHKSLLGPTGVGGLYVRAGSLLDQTRTGGTGFRSNEDHVTPKTAADYEAGTQNIAGIAGLSAALRWLDEFGWERLISHKQRLLNRLLDGIHVGVSGIRIHRINTVVPRLPTVSMTIDGLDPVTDFGPMLQHGFGIINRSGLHCSPWMHRYLGTYPRGTVRLSIGAFNTEDDVDAAASALAHIAGGRALWV
jgi:selenocysteine lyase/cysteine desulfurase